MHTVVIGIASALSDTPRMARLSQAGTGWLSFTDLSSRRQSMCRDAVGTHPRAYRRRRAIQEPTEFVCATFLVDILRDVWPCCVEMSFSPLVLIAPMRSCLSCSSCVAVDVLAACQRRRRPGHPTPGNRVQAMVSGARASFSLQVLRFCSPESRGSAGARARRDIGRQSSGQNTWKYVIYDSYLYQILHYISSIPFT